MSAFLLRFKAHYLEKMRGYLHFSLWFPIAFAKVCFFRMLQMWRKNFRIQQAPSLRCDKLAERDNNFFFVNGVAPVELLNSLDSRSSKLATDAYFILMVRTTTRKAETRRFYCCASFLRRFKIVCQDEVNFNNLLTLS